MMTRATNVPNSLRVRFLGMVSNRSGKQNGSTMQVALYGLPFTLNVAERRELLGDLAQAASLSRQGTGPIEPLRLRDDFGPLLGM